MATGIYRDPSLERLRAAQRAATVPVAGGRGTAVNTVGQAGGVRPGTGAVRTGQPVRNIVEPMGSGGRVIGSFPSGVVGDVARGLYEPKPSGPPDLSGVNWAGLGQIMRDAGRGTGAGTGDGTGSGGGTTAPVPMAPTQSDITSNLLAEFDKIRAAEEAKIASAGTGLIQALQATDPMAAFQYNPGQVTIPQATLANYVQAIGGSPAETQATQQLGQDLLNAALGDVGQFAGGVAQAAQNWRAGQQSVAAQLQADALRQLSLNAMASKMGIQANEAQRQQDLANQMLELALEYGKVNRGGTITAPQIPLTSVTLPNGQVIQLPSTMFGSSEPVYRPQI